MSQQNIWSKYSKKDTINIGEYSIFYKAIDKKTGNYVGIKEINKEKYTFLTQSNLNEKESFNFEKNFPNSISIKESLNTPQSFYIIMDYYLTNLEDYLNLRKNPFSTNEIKEILLQLNEIFKKMQKENIIYADLKVKNILLNSEDINKFQFDISYCGISQNNYNKIHSKSTNKIENYLTLSPQILKGEEFTNKTDIWSLGIIIYYLLFKKYPYNGKTEFQIINQMKAGVNLNNIENNNLKDLIKRMLEINEDVRISWEDYFNHPFFKEKNENNEDNTFTFQDFNFLCNQHNQYYDSYCFNCKKNVCKLCLGEHQLHKIILFTNIGLNKSEIEKYEKLKNEINNNLMILNKYKDEIENLLCFITNINTNN